MLRSDRRLVSRCAFLLGLTASACGSSAPQSAPETPEQASAAQASLTALGQLATSGDAGAGMNVSGATLGESMPVFMVRKDDLQAYSAGQNPRKLLNDIQRAHYPVRLGGAVRSSVTIENRDGHWQPAVLGRGNLARLIDWTRRQVLASHTVTRGNMILVEVPSLNVTLVGHDEGSTLMLTPIRNVDDTTLSAGVTVRADEALSQLAPLAASTDSRGPR
jgi:hypothetical protein